MPRPLLAGRNGPPLMGMSTFRKYDYRRKLPHIQKDTRPVFVTFVTAKRWILPEATRQLVLDACIQQHGQTCELHVAVVMPDHVHLILSPMRDGAGELLSLPEIMRRIKGPAAKAVNRMPSAKRTGLAAGVLRSHPALE